MESIPWSTGGQTDWWWSGLTDELDIIPPSNSPARPAAARARAELGVREVGPEQQQQKQQQPPPPPPPPSQHPGSDRPGGVTTAAFPLEDRDPGPAHKPVSCCGGAGGQLGPGTEVGGQSLVCCGGDTSVSRQTGDWSQSSSLRHCNSEQSVETVRWWRLEISATVMST